MISGDKTNVRTNCNCGEFSTEDQPNDRTSNNGGQALDDRAQRHARERRNLCRVIAEHGNQFARRVVLPVEPARLLTDDGAEDEGAELGGEAGCCVRVEVRLARDDDARGNGDEEQPISICRAHHHSVPSSTYAEGNGRTRGHYGPLESEAGADP